eukprot:gene16140-18425_t
MCPRTEKSTLEQLNAGRHSAPYFWRNHAGHEVDVLIKTPKACKRSKSSRAAPLPATGLTDSRNGKSLQATKASSHHWCMAEPPPMSERVCTFGAGRTSGRLRGKGADSHFLIARVLRRRHSIGIRQAACLRGHKILG